MVAPVTGPFSVLQSFSGPPNMYGYIPKWGERRKTWMRQRKPYNLPLPYDMYDNRVTSSANTREYYQEHSGIPQLPPYVGQRLYNAAYSSFMDKVRAEKAELGATLGEWKQAEKMIVTRATQLVNGFKAARRFDFTGLKRAWGKHAGINRKAKAAGNHVLEYSFGWAPLVSDVASAVEVLSKGVPPPYVKSQRSITVRYGLGTENLGAVSRNSTIRNWQLGWSLRAWIKVTNPNLLLAESLGLINLGGVLWELTPWSFVVDYFVNVNDFIGSWTDQVGLSLESPNKTFRSAASLDMNCWWNLAPGQKPPPYSPPSYTATRFSMSRTTGIPGPTLDLRLPWRMSVSRASTSISLLLQQLTDGDPPKGPRPSSWTRYSKGQWASLSHT